MIGRHRVVGDQIHRQYKRFVVDEYQDVSPLQQFLLDQWLGGRDELCVVGDPSQTIYSFAGASPKHLIGFRSRFPNATVVRLVRDYRSTPQVVTLANDLMRKQDSQAVALVAQRASGPPVGFHTYPDDPAEATAIAERIESLIESGVDPVEIAILYRTNGQSEAFEDALVHQGIGYVVRGGKRFFDRPEVRKTQVLLRAAVVGGVGDAVGEQVRDVVLDAGWTEAPPPGRGAQREQWESLQAIVELADAWDGDLASFVADLDERAAAQHEPTIAGVTLSTMHAAKGLEWDAVFLAGLSEGLMPVSMAETDEAIDEERRLLYVGITRAREHLHLSYARSRNEGGRATRKRTRFLEHEWPDPRAPRRKKPTALADLGAADAALFESLREWRLEHARAQDKPAFTVLVDSSLAQIARDRPTTLGALASIRGVGAAKIDRYGAEILALVAGHVD